MRKKTDEVFKNYLMGDLVWEAFLSKVTFELSFQSEITKPVLPSEEPSTDTPCCEVR